MAGDGFVRTVMGDVAPSALGAVDYHEHLFQVSPLLPGDELDDEARSGGEAAHLHDAGIATMVDATPVGLGRDPAGLARISASTGLTIVATTGAHRRPHYADGHPLLALSDDALTEWFIADLVHGIREPLQDGTIRDPSADEGGAARAAGVVKAGVVKAEVVKAEVVKAGVVKAGIGYWAIGGFEHRVLHAAAAASVATGAPVMVHTEHGSAGFEVLDILAVAGVPADRVALAHIDRNPDPGLHAELAATGCYLGYDGMARHREWPDSMLIDCLVAAAGMGAGERILLGGDVARATRYRAYGGMPGLDYLPVRFLPRLRAAAGDALVEQVMVTNPAAWLTWR